MAAFSGLLKRASEKANDVLQTLGIGDAMKFPGKEGDIIYSKNNVCVHPPSGAEVHHVPGYLSLHCQKDDVLGITLILQWLPNATLEKNPRSIRAVSPRGTPHTGSPQTRVKLRHLHGKKKSNLRRRSSSETSSSPVQEETGDSQSMTTPTSEPEGGADQNEETKEPHISVEMSGDNLTAVVTAASSTTSENAAGENRRRPHSLVTNQNGGNDGGGSNSLAAPCINIIPTTPTPTMGERALTTAAAPKVRERGERSSNTTDGGSPSSPATSGADEGSDAEDEDGGAEAAAAASASKTAAATSTGKRRAGGTTSGAKEDGGGSSSPYTSEDEAAPDTPTTDGETSVSALLMSFRNADWLEKTPEEFAQSHNMMLPDGIQPPEIIENEVVDSGTTHTVIANNTLASSKIGKPQHENKSPCLFSVNLGQMRSLRLFYSNSECTCGQLVIASLESQYKILHFHHGGLDKLAQIFEQWSVLRAKSKRGYDSPIAQQCRQFAVLRPELSKGEQHSEEGLYEKVTWDFWRMATNADGAIEDNVTVRKAIFFAGLDPPLRREAWPFLLHVYPWNSTREQREHIRNDLFLEYQNIRKRRLKGALKMGTKTWASVENTIGKDVVRTDRRNPYYKGDDNPNVEVMRNLLLNYAAFCPQIGYIQGMSDLLAPILAIVHEESETFWCFAGLMQRTIFVSAPRNNNNMDRNLEYLRELLKLMNPDFHKHLQSCGGDALQLLFTHRWILLCFKREFSEQDALRVWEACWANYRTSYFHLFICLSITMIYGPDVVQQKLPHDEILLYFSSLAMHMNADTVMKKARGLVYQFERLEKIPCTLGGICDSQGPDMWDAGHQPQIECVQDHDGPEGCPYTTADPLNP